LKFEALERAMTRDEIVRLYDREYTSTYEEQFLLSPLTKPDTEFETSLLRELLKPGVTWLDVACGTGYFLRQFPQVERAGIDLSPAMLQHARAANPGVPLSEHDFREPMPGWQDRWGLVSCMWYAYGLVDTVRDLVRLIENLASWTAPDGTCFVPLADPRLITGVNLPYQAVSPSPGKVMITGILWSYVEDGGQKVHSHLIAPNLEFMVEQFETFFESVSIIRYPPTFPDGKGRPALLAKRKRAFSTTSSEPGRG
jgi:SAM-dependent methyltransferase